MGDFDLNRSKSFEGRMVLIFLASSTGVESVGNSCE
jgi:hypothetical protein